MERKKKDQNIVSAEPHFLSREGENQPNVALATKSVGATSPSNDNPPALDQQQHTSAVQWSYASQYNAEQPAPTSKPCASSQSSPPISVSQWHQLPHLPLNPATHPHLAQSFPYFCLPPQHPGYHLSGVNATPLLQSFAPIGTINANWQASVLVGGETSLKDHPQVPNFHSQVGYPYPGCPGPWDPSSWWGQVQLSQPPLAYTFPGSYSQFSPQHPVMPRCSTLIGQSSQRGIIRPMAKLSQKHQQLWDAQLAENVQLWIVIGQLQSEMADYKSRMTKLEVEVSSLKQIIGVPINHVTGSAVSGKPLKRGRPRRSAASVDALPSIDESQPRTRGRKPKAPIYEKVILSKADNNVKPVHLTALAQQEKEKVSNVMTREGKGLNCSEINGNNATHTQVHEEKAVRQMGGVDSNSLEMKINKDTNDAYAILSQQAKGMDHRTALASFHAARDNGSVAWPYAIFPEGKNTLNMNSQRFYNDSSLIKQGENVITGSVLANEEDASDELDDTTEAKAMDDNEEEMEDDESSSGEEIGGPKDENLPQYFVTWS